MKHSRYLYLVLAAMPLTVAGQRIQSGYVDKGIVGSAFPEALKTWEKGQKWSEDDNFFISRVRPHERFRNTATQVNPELNEDNDKKLIFWVPANNQDFNALPDGVFDSETFPMWSYVTHYGNWSAPLVRVPAGFLDVAHKNGVPVSALATVPYGVISSEWKAALTSLTEAGAEKLSDYLLYYGVDGIGYNSEFQTNSTIVGGLMDLHENTLKRMKEQGNPLADIIWYDGTNKSGKITFDRGLAAHNQDLWGTADAPRSSLFLNYNWNYKTILDKTVANAEAYGRTPLDIYCGINMQGREPHNSSKEIWTLLEQYPLSIGLWGAHSENMFFESRAEQGPSPMKRQRTYLDRIMNWFTNGAHNPIASLETTNSLIYSAAKEDFMGMSKMMSARSALKWNLDDEPFITYFNLGNGRFLNWNGVRQHDSEWYNIAAQDYLPTWMWWWADSFLGREPENMVTDGLKAEFTWDDAWRGGSTIRIHGTSSEEFLHLFKTEFPLKSGDEITFRYKLVNGSADASIAVSLKGDESTPLAMKLMNATDAALQGGWTERKFIVGSDIAVPDGGEVAMIALHFKDASDLDMRFGEFSIKRPSAMKARVDAPVVESTKLLSARHDGVDGKIIFNMPNDKGDDVCYNTDVNVSFFKLYFQLEGSEPVLMGTTTSWAGLMFPTLSDSMRDGKVRFGVGAVAMDNESESAVSWGEWHDVAPVYAVSDEIELPQYPVKPGELIAIEYADPAHEDADWTLSDAAGNVLAEAKGALGLYVYGGVPAPGIYDLTVKGYEAGEEERVETVRVLKGAVQVTDESTGDIQWPDVNIPGSTRLDLDCADYWTEYVVETNEPTIEYTLAPKNVRMSRGVRVGDNGLGFRFKDTGMNPTESFAVSFWFKPESFADKSVHALNIRYKGDPWAVNNWGWMWHTLTEDGRSDAFTIRMKSGKDASYRFDGMKLHPGAWYNMAYSFEFDENGCVKPALFINGERQEITSWSLGDVEQEGEVGFAGPVWGWKEQNVVALGGYLHKTGSVRGNADNFMVWNKALSEEDATFAMNDVKASELPEGMIGYFDFEDDPNEDGLFDNKVPAAGFNIGIHGYIDSEVEGQGILDWRAPEFCTGCPFTSGDSFSLNADVEWYVPGAVILDREDNEEGGYVKLHYTDVSEENNRFPVHVKATNEYGSMEDRFRLVLTDGNSVAELPASNTLDVSPRVFDSEISVRVSESGPIRLMLFSMEGRCLLANDFNAQPGTTLTIHPEVPGGLYILRAESNGSLLGSAKVIRR